MNHDWKYNPFRLSQEYYIMNHQPKQTDWKYNPLTKRYTCTINGVPNQPAPQMMRDIFYEYSYESALERENPNGDISEECKFILRRIMYGA